MPACLVLGLDRCIYFDPDWSERVSSAIPRGGVQVANLLLPCYPVPASPETMERVQRLERWVQDNKPESGYLFGDLTKGGRRATAEEFFLQVERSGPCSEMTPIVSGWPVIHSLCHRREPRAFLQPYGAID